MKQPKHILFDRFCLDIVNQRLLCDGQNTGLREKSVAVLQYLAEHCGQVVDKEKLMNAVWPDVYVGEGVLKGCVKEIRKILGDDAVEPKFIKTEHGVGYRFIATVTDDSPLSSGLNRLSLLVGRHKEITDIGRLISSFRLITIIGEAGIGKTRLAQEVGTALEAQYQGAVWFVPLEDISDADLIMEKIAIALGMEHSNADLKRAVVREIAQQPALMILDNFEQIAEKGAVIVKDLLEKLPALTCLVTSRRSLNVDGERCFQISPLALPSAGMKMEELREAESIRLFLDRAQAVNQSLELSEENASHITRICERCEGLPLFIEFVATKMRVLSPTEIAKSLDRPFEILVSDRRDTVIRHRSGFNALEWGHQLLAPALQRFFVRLSIFRGGWTVEAAKRVCDEPRALEFLTSLVDESIVTRQFIVSETRFKMLKVLHEFGEGKMSKEENASTARSHAEYFFSLAEQASHKLLGAEQNTWLDRLEIERDNLRAALEYYAGTSRELELAVFMGRFWDTRGYWSEGRERLQRALKRQPGPSSLKATGLTWFGIMSYRQDDYECARRALSEAVTTSREIDDEESLAFSLSGSGLTAEAQGHYQEAKEFFLESLKWSQQVQSDWLIGWAFHGLGVVAEAEGDLTSAREFHQQSLSKREEIQELRGIATSLNNLGVVARQQGNCSSARDFHLRSLALRQGGGNKGGIALCYYNLGLVEEAVEQHGDACQFFQKSLAVRREIWDRRGIAKAMEGIARMAEAMGNGAVAARIYGAAESLRITISAPLSPTEHKRYDQIMSSVRDNFLSEWQEGERWTPEKAITYASSFDAALRGERHICDENQ